MSFDEFNSFLAPIGLIIAGLIIKFAKNKERFGTFKDKWYILVLLGLIGLSFNFW